MLAFNSGNVIVEAECSREKLEQVIYVALFADI